MRNHLLVVPIVLTGLLAANAQAVDYYVAQQDAAADDKNPGTEAKPFKTILAAVAGVNAGDTIYVKAGDYTDHIRIMNKSGRLSAPITIAAWKDDRVHIGYTPRPLPGKEAWQPIPNSKSFAAVLPEPPPDDLLVLIGDKPVVTQLRDAPPKDDQVAWATYRKSNRTLMINANGRNPAEAGYRQYSRKFEPFGLDTCDHWVIRGIEFAWMNTGLYLENCCNCVVERCYFHNTARPGIGYNGRTNVIRRCTFRDCGYALGGSGPAMIIEENLMVDCGQNAEDDVDSRAMGSVEGGGPTIFKGNNLGQVFRYNTIVEGRGGAGWYSDIDAKSCRVIGNAFWNIPPGGGMGGIYNELAVDDTLIMGNYFLSCGACTSANTRVSMIDNFFDQCCAEWLNRDIWPMRGGYMVLRGNALVNPDGGYLHFYGPGWGQTPYPEAFTNSLVDFNRIRAKAGATLINDGGAGRQVKTIDDIRKIYGWEIHGEAKTYDPNHNDLTPEAMGGSTVTYRVPWGKRSHLARPMLANADVECKWPAAPELVSVGLDTPAFFWQIADGNGDPHPLIPGMWWLPVYSRHLPNSKNGYDLGANMGCRWHVDAERKFPPMLMKVPGFAEQVKTNREFIVSYSCGNHWLVMEGRDPAKIPAQGVGYWSPPLAIAAGAQVTVSLKIRGKDLESSEKGSPAVWLEFTNATGQKRQRAFLVGRDEQGTMHHEEFTKGNYDWTEVKETIAAPAGAIRMALFFGVLPCKGHLDFDDINIKTASASGVIPREILGPRMPLARIRDTFFVDISKAANRALADEGVNDGKGGWTDQGPNCDMRELQTGRRTFGGITFDILPPPKSVVVLKSMMREPAGMPERVTIPVGRKADTLFFLHSAGWFNTFKYVIHYADGKDVEIPVNSSNMLEWTSPPGDRFPNEIGTFTTVAETVKVPQFSQGSIYRMEWGAPLDRRAVDIKSIDFIGDGKSVPVLLGITGVIEW
jgi:hypothetical protein